MRGMRPRRCGWSTLTPALSLRERAWWAGAGGGEEVGAVEMEDGHAGATGGFGLIEFFGDFGQLLDGPGGEQVLAEEGQAEEEVEVAAEPVFPQRLLKPFRGDIDIVEDALEGEGPGSVEETVEEVGAGERDF